MRLPVPRSLSLAFAAFAAASVVTPRPAIAGDVQIPFVKSTLPNGMVVVLSEDHAVPQVVLNVTYAVGSRMERPGRTGFAHLFEHLMFMGTRRAPTKAFDAWMEEAGGRNNAWTAEDRTDYFDIAPSSALPLIVWLEADRMRDLGPLIDQKKLDLQRDVVRNERRQSIENRPYGVEELALPKLLWPDAHPYHHPVIGSHEDLESASVGDVKQFFATWYDPANASLVLAGDFDPQQAKTLVDKAFATVPSQGKPADPGAPGFEANADGAKGANPSDGSPSRWPTTLTAVVRETVPDNVELTKITIAWQSPRHFGPGDAELDLLASVLAQGKESRLYKTLVYDRKIAQEVSARQESRVLGSDFVVDALVRPGVDPAKVEKALFDEIGRVRDKGVSTEELERARNTYEMEFVDRLQSIEERASLLNMYQAETGDPGFVQRDLDRYRRATDKDVLTYAKRVLLPDAAVVLTIVPRKEATR